MNHYEERLEADLANIVDHLRGLGNEVKTAIHDAVQALLTGNDQLANQTVLGDNPINRHSQEVERLCHAFIARHLPSAGHLRLVSSAIRVNITLERVGDYAVTIAREALRLSGPVDAEQNKVLSSVAWGAESLLTDAVSAFCDRNEADARALMPVTKRMELGMDDIYQELFEGDSTRSSSETVSIFVVYNQLKRVADQSKNICDRAVFAITGETKSSKAASILFVDNDNTCHSQLAAALAKKMYPESGSYASAGANPGDEADPMLVDFLNQRGIDASGLQTRGIEALTQGLSEYNVVISLDRPVKEYITDLPFHTSSLLWEMPEISATSNEAERTERYESLYRALADKLAGLMLILVGQNAR